jgi:RNA polymerase-binding protein DksA
VAKTSVSKPSAGKAAARKFSAPKSAKSASTHASARNGHRTPASKASPPSKTPVVKRPAPTVAASAKPVNSVSKTTTKGRAARVSAISAPSASPASARDGSKKNNKKLQVTAPPAVAKGKRGAAAAASAAADAKNAKPKSSGILIQKKSSVNHHASRNAAPAVGSVRAMDRNALGAGAAVGSALPPPPPPQRVTTHEKPKKNQAGLTPKELEHFRELLLAKRRELVGDMSSMEREALRSATGSNLSNLPLHMADMGTDNYEQEFTLGLVEKDRQLLREINQALAKIQDGRYGICEGTGKPISKPRLEAQPWARFSIEYARLMERGLVPRR